MQTIKLPVPITTAEALLLARRGANVTQDALADMCCLSRRQMSHLENGHSAITPSTGMLLALVLERCGASALQTIAAVAPADQRMVSAAPKPAGRPYQLKPGEFASLFRLPDGSEILWPQVKELPLGTPYEQKSSANGPWVQLVRTHPNALMDPHPGSYLPQTLPVPTQTRHEPGMARLSPDGEIAWQQIRAKLDPDIDM